MCDLGVAVHHPQIVVGIRDLLPIDFGSTSNITENIGTVRRTDQGVSAALLEDEKALDPEIPAGSRRIPYGACRPHQRSQPSGQRTRGRTFALRGIASKEAVNCFSSGWWETNICSTVATRNNTSRAKPIYR